MLSKRPFRPRSPRRNTLVDLLRLDGSNTCCSRSWESQWDEVGVVTGNHLGLIPFNFASSMFRWYVLSFETHLCRRFNDTGPQRKTFIAASNETCAFSYFRKAQSPRTTKKHSKPINNRLKIWKELSNCAMSPNRVPHSANLAGVDNIFCSPSDLCRRRHIRALLHGRLKIFHHTDTHWLLKGLDKLLPTSRRWSRGWITV